MLVGLGYIGLTMIIMNPMRGLRWGLGFIVFGGFGLWFLYETFKKTHYLRVICRNDKRKLVFRGTFQEADFSKFINDATKLGYSFKDCVKNN